MVLIWQVLALGFLFIYTTRKNETVEFFMNNYRLVRCQICFKEVLHRNNLLEKSKDKTKKKIILDDAQGDVPCEFPGCFLSVPFCSLSVPCVFSRGSLSVPCVFPVCSSSPSVGTVFLPPLLPPTHCDWSPAPLQSL